MAETSTTIRLKSGDTLPAPVVALGNKHGRPADLSIYPHARAVMLFKSVDDDCFLLEIPGEWRNKDAGIVKFPPWPDGFLASIEPGNYEGWIVLDYEGDKSNRVTVDKPIRFRLVEAAFTTLSTHGKK